MRWGKAFILLAMLFTGLPAVLQAQGFSIEQAMSAPFSYSLEAAPKGNRLAWLTNQQGHRNVWVAEPQGPGFAARELTHYDEDDGVEISDLTWAPDGEQLLYVRGGDAEAPEKPAPNPALSPQPVEQDIWSIPVSGGEPRKLAEGRSPAISPDGLRVAYLLKGQVWTIGLHNSLASAAQLFHGRGSFSGLRWSPDGKYLAFTSHREDHSFVGVYNFAAKTIAYLDPATTFDDYPVWSPNGRTVAFVRVPPAPSSYEFKPVRTAQPWSIMVADAATGQAHSAWVARAGQGSAFHEIPARDQLTWGAGNTIVFPWEADGWVHLYSAPAGGGEAKLLTPGDFEVEHVAVSPDHATMVYSSNQHATDAADEDRRHLWSVAVVGGKPKQLTKGTGIEVSPAITSDGKTIAALRSDVRTPMRAALIVSDQELKDLAPQLMAKDFPATQFTVPQQVIFNAADGMQIHGQLFMPAADGHRHPAAIFFHGGSRRQMLLGWHYMEYYSNAYAMNQYLASLGYIVLSVNYRSGIGYGLEFREAIHYGAAGASEFNDVLGAGLYLRGRTDVDGAKIGVWGGSYGGYLTALALARASDLFAAGVDMHGVHDWNIELGNWRSYDPNADPDAAKVAFDASPLASVKTWRSPVLLMQGDDDRNVQFSQMVKLAAALRAQGVPFEEHVFPDEIHDFLLHRSWLTAYGLEAAFFDKYLRHPR